MRKRLIYGSGVFLLVILIALVVWQGSLNFGVYQPEDTAQTLLIWAVSTLIFVLMVALGFMLVRNFVKLLVERRSNREGSRIKTKLVAGALALSFMPVFFMVFFSFQIMSHNLEKWFAKPVSIQRADFIEIANALSRELQDKVNAQAALLAAMPETHLQLAGGKVSPGWLQQFCKEQGLIAVSLQLLGSPDPAASCGAMPKVITRESDYSVARRPVFLAAREIGFVKLVSRVPVDVQAKRREIETYNQSYLKLEAKQHLIREQYLLLMCLITLFILFVATWIALFLAKQISVPIAALLEAAEEVGKGNLALSRGSRRHRRTGRPGPRLQPDDRRSWRPTAANSTPPPLHRSHPRKHSHRRHLHRPPTAASSA